MSRVVITSAAVIDGYRFKRGDCVELTAAQITALGASAGAVIARDLAGENVAISNSSA